jgi:exodeoxyribonuclease (lambda-induced)
MKIYEELNQNTEEWQRIRAGKLTASNFHTLMGKSETKNNILLQKTAERLLNRSLESDYTNQDMERGRELEEEARLLYEMQTDKEATIVGFIELNTSVGCSPDDLIGEDGIIEIKCPKETVFIGQVIRDKIKPEYYTQIQFNLYVSNRQYCDYIAHNRNFNLFVKRIERDEDYIKKIKETIEECESIIEENMSILRGKNVGILI